MTPEAKRIAIAEACGWKISPYKANPDRTGFLWGYKPDQQTPPGCSEPVPDYLNDLNAMHKAERAALVVFKDGVKWRDYRNEYKDWLWTICAPSRSGEDTGWGFPEFSTAAIKAEALLKTLGLWKE